MLDTKISIHIIFDWSKTIVYPKYVKSSCENSNGTPVAPPRGGEPFAHSDVFRVVNTFFGKTDKKCKNPDREQIWST